MGGHYLVSVGGVAVAVQHSSFMNDRIMLPFRNRLIALCPACGAVLPPLRGFVSAAGNIDSGRLSPDRVVVMHKTSRLEFERKRNKHLSESQLHTEVSVGIDILDRLGQRNVFHACVYTYMRV